MPLSQLGWTPSDRRWLLKWADNVERRDEGIYETCWKIYAKVNIREDVS